ncbi:hypothetical protein [Streptomyces sp. NBRC 109706]|uniref:hypothetical protein n=1 Tax=Streptomyces sp. NBRC 109706 TaxID=1550035 RepID=UPI000A797F6E|nr:hypothetical protein [Streptomyces sp. NBRC 109706]
MSNSRRRAVLRCVTAFAFGALVLTGCGGGEDDSAAPETSTTPAPSDDGSASSDAAGGDQDPDDTTEDDAAQDDTSESGSESGSGADDTSGSDDTAPWAGTKQFVQIEDSWTSEGQTYLSVRPAQKEALTEPHEAWVVVPSEGPYTTVPVADDAVVMLSVPLGDASQAASYSQDEFVSRLTAQPASARPGLGYDLSFDGAGQVTRLESLYMS